MGRALHSVGGTRVSIACYLGISQKGLLLKVVP